MGHSKDMGHHQHSKDIEILAPHPQGSSQETFNIQPNMDVYLPLENGEEVLVFFDNTAHSIVKDNDSYTMIVDGKTVGSYKQGNVVNVVSNEKSDSYIFLD